MSTSTPTYLPAGSIRSGFETAARAHEAARTGGSARQIAPLRHPGTPVETAIARAAEATTVDFGYLLAQAEVESGMDPDARAATSSATGLYQFIESTWLDTVKKHGPRFGLGVLAEQIDITASGSAYVADPSQRQAILALRADPAVAALMAAGLAEDNRAYLAPILGRQPDHAELYLAHFLGAGGAGRFLSELQADPSQSAPALFARPAAANRAIFYAPDGSPRSLAGVMEALGRKLDRALERAGSGATLRFARADHDATGTSAALPNLIADAAVLGPGAAPMLTPAIMPARSSPPRIAMSQVLGTAFGNDPGAAPAQVRRAYDQLRAFGL
ncbi:MAG: transglycosylase SLT domain-containing protein [Erythrobacter sp.]